MGMRIQTMRDEDQILRGIETDLNTLSNLVYERFDKIEEMIRKLAKQIVPPKHATVDFVHSHSNIVGSRKEVATEWDDEELTWRFKDS
jgi:hypothetical protein